MIGYLLPVTCPKCGEQLEHVTGSILAGTETAAVANCAKCDRDYLLSVQIRPLSKPRRAA